MTLMEAIDKVREVKQAIIDGKPLTAWKLTLPVQEFIIDIGIGFGVSNAVDVATLQQELQECATLAGGITAASGPEAAKLGDGTLLKLFLELLLKLGPIFMSGPAPAGS